MKFSIETTANSLAPLNESGNQSRRSIALWELVSIIMTVLIIEWVLIPFAGRSSLLVLVPLTSCAVLMFTSARQCGETRRDLGIRFDNFLDAARLLLMPMLIGGAALAICGWLLREAGYGEPRAAGRILLKLALWGVLWGFVQQYVLQAYVNRRAQVAMGGGVPSVLYVACIFALLHAPNLGLMIATFAGGLMWAYVYQKAPNLFALALSHGVMTWVLVSSIPAPLLKGMRAGYNYFL